MQQQPNNPFIVTGFWSESYFCDREQELQWMHDNFTNERNMVLYAWRRIGKSALVRCFFHELQEKEQVDTVYIDLMGTQNFAEALREITRKVYEQYGRTESGLSAALSRLLSQVGVSVSFSPDTGTPQLNFNWTDPPVPERSLEALGTFLQERPVPVLICLDEFQVITRYPDAKAEALFRGWMQNFPRIRFIFSGSHRNMMHSMFTESNRAFYRSTENLSLEPIPEEDYRPFIQQHFKNSGKKISDPLIHQLYTWARGQTYTIQLICNKLFGNCEVVSEEDLQKVYEEIIEQEKPVFANYANLLTEKQWAILKAFAKEEPLTQPLRQEFLNKYQLGAGSTVSTALKTLQQKEFIIREGDAYYVHDVLLARWLQSL